MVLVLIAGLNGGSRSAHLFREKYIFNQPEKFGHKEVKNGGRCGKRKPADAGAPQNCEKITKKCLKLLHFKHFYFKLSVKCPTLCDF